MQLNSLARPRLQTRVTLSTLAVLLLGLWSLFLYASQALKDELREAQSAQQLSSVSLLAGQLAQRLDERLLWLQRVADELGSSPLTDPTALQDRLNRQALLSNEFNAGLLVFNARGQALAGTAPRSAQAGQAGPDLGSVTLALKQGHAAVGQVFVDAGLGAPVFDLSAVIKNNTGQVTGTVTWLTRLKDSSLLRSLSHSRYGKSGGYLLIDPQQRRVIGASDPQRVMEALPAPGIVAPLDSFIEGFEGSAVLVNPDGQDMLASAKRLPGSGWIVAALLPTDEAFAPISNLQQDLLLATVLLSLLGGGLGWWLVHRQLAELLDALKALSRQAPDREIPAALAPRAPAEIRELLQSFNRLLETLAQRKQALRAQQDRLARTEELAHVGSWEIDIGSGQVQWSQELFHLFHLDPAGGAPSLVQQAKLFSAADFADFKAALEQARLYAIPFELELHAIRKDGSQRYYLARGQAQRDSERVVRQLVGSMQDITELKQTQETLQKSFAALQSALQTTLDGFIRSDARGRLLQINPAYCAMSDYTEGELLQMSLADLEAADSAQRTAARMSHILQHGRDQFETRHRRKDGSFWDVEVSVTVNPAGERELFFFVRDISARKAAQLRLELSASVFSHAHEGISITDVNANLIKVNDTFCQITGYARHEVIGKNCRLLKSGRQDEAFYRALWKALLVNGHWSGEIWNRRKNGELYPALLTISAVRDEHGVTRQYVALFSDISERKLIEERVRQLAFFDALTNLPNRRLLTDRLSQTLLSNKRSGRYGAVLFLDLDNFKPLNDRCGHAVGDLLLIEVARRIKATVREADTVARLGGDEFVVVLGELDLSLAGSQAQALAIAEKIRQSLSQVYQLGPGNSAEAGSPPIEHHCTASIGVALFDPAQTELQALLQQADQAMYQAKASGRNRVVLHQGPQPMP